VRISDISVSRIHSKIYFSDNKLYLEDCGSKFGTLVLAKEEVEINENVKILQIGRTLVSSQLTTSANIQKLNEVKISIQDSKSDNKNDTHNLLNFNLEEGHLEFDDYDKDKNNI